jgi:hypothetical protein
MRKFLIYVFSIGWIIPIWIGLTGIVNRLRGLELGGNEINSISQFYVYSLVIKIGLVWLSVVIQ